MYQPKNILVTGAAGFIGSNFVRYMLTQYSNVRIFSFDKLTYAGNKDNLLNLPNSQNHKFILGDICDRETLDKLLEIEKIETIVHFAAESHVDRSISGPSEFIQTNLVGTFNLLESAYQYWIRSLKLDAESCRFHHISTDEVYGSLGQTDPAFHENTQYAPNSPYSATKAGSDHLVRAYFHTYSLPSTTSNCSNNYGPYQHSEKLIPTVIRSCLAQKPIPVYGNGKNVRDWLYVVDHCEAIDQIIRRGRLGETYNIGGNCEFNNLDLVYKICSLMNMVKSSHSPYEKLVTFVTDRLGHDFRYAINNEKIRKELGWIPKHKIEDGLKQTIEYYIKQI